MGHSPEILINSSIPANVHAANYPPIKMKTSIEKLILTQSKSTFLEVTRCSVNNNIHCVFCGCTIQTPESSNCVITCTSCFSLRICACGSCAHRFRWWKVCTRANVYSNPHSNSIRKENQNRWFVAFLLRSLPPSISTLRAHTNICPSSSQAQCEIIHKWL